MANFLNKFKIPTVLGLGIILLGLVSGLYLILREQMFVSQAAPNLTPQNITLTNITDNSAVISWQTNTPAASFITFGQNSPSEQTVLDDRDINGPKPHLTHYVSLKNLLPQTRYQFRIISGKLASTAQSFDTAKPSANTSEFTPIIGSVAFNNSPLNDGIAYLIVAGAVTQSALVKSGGNFLIPLSEIRKADLSDIYPLAEDTIAKITIAGDKETANLLFKLTANSSPLPSIKLGQDLDLTAPESSPSPPIQSGSPNPVSDLDKYDLNSDGTINSTDYSILSFCSGKKPTAVLPGNPPAGEASKSCTKADINSDGKIDQKDVDLMSQRPK